MSDDEDMPLAPPPLLRSTAAIETISNTCIGCRKPVTDIINDKCHKCQAAANDGKRSNKRRSNKRRSNKKRSNKRRSKKLNIF